MAYVDGYEHDIFVSYAHIDNQLVPSVKTGWVSSLVQHLEVLLAQKLGTADASLWMDYCLLPYEPLSEALLSTLKHSATLVLILSPSYLTSSWCQRERNTFLNMVAGRVRAGTRIFVVERERVDIHDKPEEIRELLGYHFWVAEQGKRSTRWLGFPQPLPDDRDYYTQVLSLAGDLAAELKRLKDSADSTIVRADTHPTVFVAEVTDDLITQRDEVRHYLEQADFRVLPDANLQYLYWQEFGKLKSLIGKNLQNCCLFVQLLSGLTGQCPPDRSTLARLQYEAARDSGIPILQGCIPERPRQADIDPDQWELLNGAHVFVGNIEAFKREVMVHAQIKPKQNPPSSSPGKWVYLNACPEDKTLSKELGCRLKSRGITSIESRPRGTSKQIREDFRAGVLHLDGVVVFYGAASHDWVRAQLIHCKRLEAIRTHPLQAKAIYQGPPENKEPVDIISPEILLIDCCRGLDDTQLQPLFNALQ